MAYVITPKAYDSRGAVSLPVVSFSYASGQRIAVGSASAQSAAITSEFIAIKSNTDCFINIGSNPTATVGAGSWPMFAGETLYTAITSGHKLAAIRTSADGFITIMPVATA